MTKIILSDNSNYELKENEHLTFGSVGVYVWDRPQSNKDGSEHYPPVKFYVYGYVQEVIDERSNSKKD